jgi:hypothetical protein
MIDARKNSRYYPLAALPHVTLKLRLARTQYTRDVGFSDRLAFKLIGSVAQFSLVRV